MTITNNRKALDVILDRVAELPNDSARRRVLVAALVVCEITMTPRQWLALGRIAALLTEPAPTERKP